MKFLHLSREAAEHYLGTEPYAMISMTDPDAAVATLRQDPRRRALLRLQFHDISESVAHLKSLGFTSAELDKYTMPTPEHAKAIVEFFRSLPPDVKLCIAHCEAGISRSSAVAFALGFLSGDDYLPPAGARFAPNGRLLKLIHKAWEEKWNG